VASNIAYAGADELPGVIPVFPLGSVVLLPRTELPLNIFEPRYLAMVDDALRGERIIGMIQPSPDASEEDERPQIARVGCAGRLTSFQETGDGRYLVTLTGIARFRVDEELSVTTPYRQCRVALDAFPQDYVARAGEDEVDRAALLATLETYLRANSLEADWDGINRAPNEALVNALAMMSPFGPREKQALLEAPDLKSRAEILVAVTEMEFARSRGTGDTTLQLGEGMDKEKAGAPATTVDPKLLEILVCPLTKATLEYDAARQELISRPAKLAYPIRDGIPIMLPEEARSLAD
jgi:Lon protease-like protein/uncharacterized protein YbaR (Trm112 family)